MTQEDIDAMFAGMTADVDLEVPEGTVDFTEVSSLELSEQYNAARDELLETGEMREPRTERGRELHSIRAATLMELKRRRLA